LKKKKKKKKRDKELSLRQERGRELKKKLYFWLSIVRACEKF